MEEIAKVIAANPILQAIAIIVAVGTLFFFLIKNIPIIYRSIMNIIRFGIKKALALAAKPAILRAQESYRDTRLIVLWISYLSMRSIFRISIITMAYLVLIAFHAAYDLKRSKIDTIANFSNNDIVWLVLTVPITFISVFILFYPLFILVTYMILTRRKILRELKMANRIDPVKRKGKPFSGTP